MSEAKAVYYCALHEGDLKQFWYCGTIGEHVVALVDPWNLEFCTVGKEHWLARTKNQKPWHMKADRLKEAWAPIATRQNAAIRHAILDAIAYPSQVNASPEKPSRPPLGKPSPDPKSKKQKPQAREKKAKR